MVLLEAAPTARVDRCDSTVFKARQRDVYLDMFRECGLELRALTGVDPAPFRTQLLPHVRRLPGTMSLACWRWRPRFRCPSTRFSGAAPSNAPGMPYSSWT